MKFVSDKKPIIKIKNKLNLKISKLFGKNNISVIKKINPPEKGGVILLLIKFLCLDSFF